MKLNMTLVVTAVGALYRGALLNFLLRFSHSNFKTVHILLFCDVA